MNKSGCLIVLGFIVVIGIMCALTSCCANICGQGAPELRPMPECGVYYVEDIIEIPVEQGCK
jgi:hypothetical protein